MACRALVLLLSVGVVVGCSHPAPPAPPAPPVSPEAIVWPLALDHVSTPASHREAVLALLTESGVEAGMTAMKDVLLRQQVEMHPVIKPYEKVLREFLDKYASFEALRDDLARIYMERFTELQLRQILAFYRTPTGKLAVRELPKVVQLGAELGKQKVQDHMPELKQMIEKQAAPQ